MTATTNELALIECDAEPRHLEMWYRPDEDDWYPPGCPWCFLESANAAHEGCDHSHHKAWRRWRITGWIGSQLYTSGLTSSGGSWRMGGGCMGCRTLPPRSSWSWKRRRPYVLWVRTDTWRCLLKGHHRPGDLIAFGYCSKCLPCPDCGSKTAGHAASCPESPSFPGWETTK